VCVCVCVYMRDLGGKMINSYIGSLGQSIKMIARIDSYFVKIFILCATSIKVLVFFDEQVGRFELVRILSASCRVVELAPRLVLWKDIA